MGNRGTCKLIISRISDRVIAYCKPDQEKRSRIHKLLFMYVMCLFWAQFSALFLPFSPFSGNRSEEHPGNVRGYPLKKTRPSSLR